MSEKREYLVAGLGNPGVKYKDTRHNVGFLVIDHISASYGIPFDKQKFNAIFGRGAINDIKVILAKPLAFMNKSGPPLKQLLEYFRILHRDMLVIHDDIDLVYGRIKVKAKGGHGGHNGVRSIINAVGDDAFTRLRIGIGRSESGGDVSDHVLGRFYSDEMDSLKEIIERSRNAVETILCEGTREGMNRYNDRRFQPPS